MHFFFPVHAARLVEVVRSASTSSETVETVEGVARSVGKAAEPVDDPSESIK